MGLIKRLLTQNVIVASQDMILDNAFIIADYGLKKEFVKMKTEGLSFEEVASKIHYDRYKSLQVSFCTPYSLTILNKV